MVVATAAAVAAEQRLLQGPQEGQDVVRQLLLGHDLGELDAAFSTFHKLADEAPSEIDKDWKKLDGAITTVEKALKDAGLSFADLDKIQKGQMPENVDASKLQGLANEMTKLSGSDFTTASKAIEKHAKKTCKVDLNAS